MKFGRWQLERSDNKFRSQQQQLKMKRKRRNPLNPDTENKANNYNNKL